MSTAAFTSSTVGRTLRALRERASLPLDRVARDTGLSPPELAGIESGRTKPSIAVLDRIARAMGSTLTDVVRNPSLDGHAAIARDTAGPRLGLRDIARAIAELPDQRGSKLDATACAAVLHAMNVCSGNQSAAARLLGMERKAFVRRLRRARRVTRHRPQDAAG